MGITNSNKQIDVNQIGCDGTLKVTISLSAAPDISANPTDIVLVLDQSGSMAGSPLTNMKIGAETFIDIIDEATDSSQDGSIGSGSHIGIVSFSDTATADTQLTTSVAELKAAVGGLTAGGSTNHADAFTKAVQLFDPASANAKVIVMFTDGNTTSGPPPAPVAAAARAAGIVIYCIGLIGSNGVDVATLNDWATDPDASHVAVTPDETELEDLFADLAANISKPGATDIVINEVVNSDFVITSVLPPNKGMTMMIDSNTLQWKIPQLGVSGSEGASLEFFHPAHRAGFRYQAGEPIHRLFRQGGNVVTFRSPLSRWTAASSSIRSPARLPVKLTVEGCQDSIVVDLGDTYLESLGRIVQLDVTLKRICPGKRVALAIILTEVDDKCEGIPAA